MPGDRNSTLCSHCVSFTFAWCYCRLLFENFCILCSMLNRCWHGRPQKFFQGDKVNILLFFFRLLAMQRKWTYTKTKMSSVTATVAYSVFLWMEEIQSMVLTLVKGQGLGAPPVVLQFILGFSILWSAIASSQRNIRYHFEIGKMIECFWQCVFEKF